MLPSRCIEGEELPLARRFETFLAIFPFDFVTPLPSSGTIDLAATASSEVSWCLLCYERDIAGNYFGREEARLEALDLFFFRV